MAWLCKMVHLFKKKKKSLQSLLCSGLFWLVGNFAPGCENGLKGFEKERVHGRKAHGCERVKVE